MDPSVQVPRLASFKHLGVAVGVMVGSSDGASEIVGIKDAIEVGLLLIDGLGENVGAIGSLLMEGNGETVGAVGSSLIEGDCEAVG